MGYNIEIFLNYTSINELSVFGIRFVFMEGYLFILIDVRVCYLFGNSFVGMLFCG